MIYNNFIIEIVQLFLQQRGLFHLVQTNQSIFTIVILLFAIICCFAGYRMYPLMSGLIAFFVTGIVLEIVLSPYVHKGVIVTAISLIGMIMLFLAFNWHRPTGVIFAYLIGAGFCFIFTRSVFICSFVGIVAGCLAILRPKHAIIACTALYGAVISSKILLDMFNPQTEMVAFYSVVLVVFLIGGLIQLKSNGLSLRIHSGTNYKMLDRKSKIIRNEVDENGQEYSPKYVTNSQEDLVEK